MKLFLTPDINIPVILNAFDFFSNLPKIFQKFEKLKGVWAGVISAVGSHEHAFKGRWHGDLPGNLVCPDSNLVTNKNGGPH